MTYWRSQDNNSSSFPFFIDRSSLRDEKSVWKKMTKKRERIKILLHTLSNLICPSLDFLCVQTLNRLILRIIDTFHVNLIRFSKQNLNWTQRRCFNKFFGYLCWWSRTEAVFNISKDHRGIIKWIKSFKRFSLSLAQLLSLCCRSPQKPISWTKYVYCVLSGSRNLFEFCRTLYLLLLSLTHSKYMKYKWVRL